VTEAPGLHIPTVQLASSSLRRDLRQVRTVMTYRGSRKHLRFIKGRDEAYPIVWVFAMAMAAFLLLGAVAFFSP
jgi:hypothetical protein